MKIWLSLVRWSILQTPAVSQVQTHSHRKKGCFFNDVGLLGAESALVFARAICCRFGSSTSEDF